MGKYEGLMVKYSHASLPRNFNLGGNEGDINNYVALICNRYRLTMQGAVKCLKWWNLNEAMPCEILQGRGV